MPALTRGGFTLPELVVSLAVLGLLAGVAAGLLRETERLYRTQAPGIEVRQNLRIAAAFLPAELRELDAADGDIVAVAPTAITIRASRQLAVLCRGPRLDAWPAPVTLTLADAPFYGLRDFAVGTDSVWVYAAGSGASRDDDWWILGSVASLAPDTCPDGRTARRLTTTLLPGPGRALSRGAIQSGAPVRGFETLIYRLYRSSEDNRWYVGMKSATDLQPVLGPVTNDGLAFAYFDSSGATTIDPVGVRLIEIRVRARATEPSRRADGRLENLLDSVVATISLRNNRRH